MANLNRTAWFAVPLALLMHLSLSACSFDSESQRKEYCTIPGGVAVVSNKLNGQFRETFCVNDTGQRHGRYTLYSFEYLADSGSLLEGNYQNDKAVGIWTDARREQENSAKIPVPRGFADSCLCADQPSTATIK